MMKGLGFLVLAAMLSGCLPAHRPAPAPTVPGAGEMHERLSAAIKQDGFRHGVRSERSDERDVDSVFVALPIDAIKRRHESLERLLDDIATICLAVDFADYPILIELSTTDAEDFDYMKGVLAPRFVGRKNIRVEGARDSRSDITITLVKPKKR